MNALHKFYLMTCMMTAGVCMLILPACTRISHNANMVGIGKVTKVGVGEYGLIHVNGMLVVEGVRENTETVIETNDGDSMATGSSAVVKGIRAIRFRTGPQVTGYLVDLAGKDEEAAREYIQKMPSINSVKWDSKYTNSIDVPALQPQPRTAEETAKEIEDIVNPFSCPNGNCELKDLWKNNTISYQTAVATKLLTYADTTSGWEDDAVTYRGSLQMFLTRMAQLSVKGKTVTQMRVKYATIKDNVLVDLKYVMIEPDGNEFDTNCPECVLLDMDE